MRKRYENSIQYTPANPNPAYPSPAYPNPANPNVMEIVNAHAKFIA